MTTSTAIDKVLSCLYEGSSDTPGCLFAEAGAGALLVTALDEVAWLLNLRGGDVSYNPVFVSYVVVEQQTATLYVDQQKVGLIVSWGSCAADCYGFRAETLNPEYSLCALDSWQSPYCDSIVVGVDPPLCSAWVMSENNAILQHRHAQEQHKHSRCFLPSCFTT